MTPNTPDPVHLAMARAMQGLTVGYRPVPGMPGGGDHVVTGSWVRPGTGEIILDLFRAARGSNDVDRKTAALVTEVTVMPECVADYMKRLPGEYAKTVSS